MVGAVAGLYLWGMMNEAFAKTWKSHCSVVGMNPFYDTDFIARSHLACEQRGMITSSGDVSGWDYHIHSMLFVGIAYIRYNLLHWKLHTPEIYAAVINYYRHVVYTPISTMFGVFSFNGKQKSGYGNTIDDNCIINAIIFHYIILTLYPDITFEAILQNFLDHYCGDDELWSTFAAFLPSYYVSMVALRDFGLTINIEPGTTIRNVSFCSANFGYSLSMKRFVRIPDWNRIRASACYYNKSVNHLNKIMNLAVLAYPNKELYYQLRSLWHLMTSDPFPLSENKIRRLYTFQDC
jgi:hypothetical protein